MPFDPYEIYQKMFESFGPQGWWPGRTKAEILVGAVLTQNTAWINVEKSIRVLRQNRCLTLKALHHIPQRKLADYIRSSGYFNIKAKRLKNIVRFIFNRFGGNLKRMFRQDLHVLRHELLGVNGIGPETADSILLYAGGKPSFVFDAYTRRILLRHHWIADSTDYEEAREFFMKKLKHEPQMFNEYHALFVYVGKHYCLKKSPCCQECPLKEYLP